jgi:DNA-binding XRE family transcriptional regulator
MHLYFVFYKKHQYVLTSTPELYNGVGGERTVKDLNLDYMGPMLKDARLKVKLTQDEVAERVGITTRYLMAIENEGKCPALDVWFRLIHALHISADGIVYPRDAAEKETDEQLLCMIRLLNSRDKKIVQASIQAMLDN